MESKPKDQDNIEEDYSEEQLALLIDDSLERYHHARKWWNILLMTLPIDFLFYIGANRFQVEKEFLSYLEVAFYTFLLLSLTTLFREEIVSVLIRLNGLQQKVQSKTKNYAPYIAIVAVVIVLADIVHKLSSLGIIPILIMAGIIVSQYTRIKKQFQDIVVYDDLSEKEGQVHKARMIHQQVTGVILATYAFVRAASFLGAIYVGALNQPDLHMLLLLTATIVIFLIGAPEEEEFLINCKRCAAKTSRAFRDTMYCPFCIKKNYKRR